jgi:hypothetical protein
VHFVRRSITVGIALSFLSFWNRAGYAQAWQNAVDQAAVKAPEARIVVLDIATGRLLAAHRSDEAARTLAAPGSTLKPLVLYGLLDAGRWNPGQRVSTRSCRPQAGVFAPAIVALRRSRGACVVVQQLLCRGYTDTENG